MSKPHLLVPLLLSTVSALTSACITPDEGRTGVIASEVDQGWWDVWCPGPEYDCRNHEIAPGIFLGAITGNTPIWGNGKGGSAYFHVEARSRALWFEAWIDTKCADGSHVTGQLTDTVQKGRLRQQLFWCETSPVSEYSASVHLDF